MARAKAVLESVPSAPNGRAAKRERRPAPRQSTSAVTARPSGRSTSGRCSRSRFASTSSALIVMLATGVVLWWIASAVGAVHNIEHFVGEIVNDNKFHFLSWEVLRGATIIGLVLVCVLVVITVLAAAFYNLFSELIGGLEVTVVEHEDTR